MKAWKKIALAAASCALATSVGLVGSHTYAQAAAPAVQPTAISATGEPTEEPVFFFDDVRKYARSMSPVALEVSFAELTGSPGSAYQGRAYATSFDSGRITLSNTTARDWHTANNSTIRNLIVHEIGHAVSIKCEGLLNGPQFNGDGEAWATAYAWSRGFTGNGSGANIYGTPTFEQVREAGHCR